MVVVVVVALWQKLFNISVLFHSLVSLGLEIWLPYGLKNAAQIKA